jgi:hypothetical protein
VLFGPRKQRHHQETGPEEKGISTEPDRSTDIITEEVPNAKFGHLIPLEGSGLRRRSERVYSRRWEVYITIAEKPAAKKEA